MNTPNLPTVARRSTPSKRVKEFERASHELENLDQDDPKQILKLAGTMDLMKSSVLAGFLGGSVGATGGVMLSGIVVAGLALPAVVITGPLGMAAGVAIAILAWRGKDWWRVEKAIAQTRLRLDEIDARIRESLKQIDALPAKAPQYVRDAMWKAHAALVEQRRHAESSMSDSPSEDYDRLSQRPDMQEGVELQEGKTQAPFDQRPGTS
jgi:hypothetical protein